jgi:hypothetical protein
MQVIADHFREDLLLRVAVNYQHATTWHQAWPDMIRTGIAETTTQRKECS